MTFRKRYLIILIANTLLSIVALSSIPFIVFRYLNPKEYKNTGLMAPINFHKELYGRLTEDEILLNELPRGPHLAFIITKDRGVIYSKGLKELDSLTFDSALEGINQINSVHHRFRAESFSYKGDYGVFVFKIDRKSLIGTIRLYLVPISFLIILFFVIIPAIVNMALLYNLKKSFNKLEQAADKISRGDYELNLKRKSRDELYNFYQSFNRMALTLKENRDEKSRLLMSISHDLKTPLTSMKGYIEAFNDGLVPIGKEPKYHNIIKDKTLLLEDRINSLIDFAKLDTANWINSFQNIEAYPFLLEIAQAFKEDSIIYNREFDFLLHVPYGISIKGDSRLLMRAIENLLENAKRYTNEMGKISLKAYMKGMNLITEVTDNGKGISDEDIDSIFKPFYKVDKGRNSIGMGMGLYNVKTIIESHVGSIRCESKVNEGSKFIITFPLRDV